MKIKTKQTLLSLLQGGLVGLVLGFVIISFEIKELNFQTYHIALILLSIILGFILTVIIHEGGHLIMGLLTGYEFLSFRIFSWHFQKNEEGKIRVYNHKVPGTLGQCLLIPPKVSPAPVFWYNFGGVLLNFLTFFILFMISMFSKNATLYVILMSIAIVNLFFAITNWMVAPGLSNDGYNHKMIKNNEKSREAFQKILEINALVSQGEPFSEINLDSLKGLDYTDSIQVNAGMYLMSQASNSRDYETYESLYHQLIEEVRGNQIIEPLLEMDYYFMKLVQNDPEAQKYKTKQVEKILKLMRNKESIMIVLLLEDYRLNGTYSKTLYNEFVQACENSIQPGVSQELLIFGNELLDLNI